MIKKKNRRKTSNGLQTNEVHGVDKYNGKDNFDGSQKQMVTTNPNSTKFYIFI